MKEKIEKGRIHLIQLEGIFKDSNSRHLILEVEEEEKNICLTEISYDGTASLSAIKDVTISYQIFEEIANKVTPFLKIQQ